MNNLAVCAIFAKIFPLVSIVNLHILGILALLLAHPLTSSANDCIENRYAFDVGSGAIKTTGNKVDKCKGEILEKLGEHNVHIKYESCMQHKEDKLVISQDCINQTKEAIQGIEKAYDMDCATSRCAGVATAWARKASNASELLKLFKAEKIDIEVLPQEDEGELGFYTAKTDVAAKNTVNEKIVVWDLGGGSFQLSALDSKKEIHVYNGMYGVESFDKMIRKAFIHDDAIYFDKEKIDKAIDFTVKKLGYKIRKDSVIRNRVLEKDVVVYAIGRPMYRGIRETLNFNEVVTKEQIYNAAVSFSGKSVAEVQKIYPMLPDHYVRQSQPALILIYSIMEGLGIDQIHILNTKASDYISIDERYWD